MRLTGLDTSFSNMVAQWATVRLNLVAQHKDWLPRVCFMYKHLIQVIIMFIQFNVWLYKNELFYNIDQEIKHLFRIF